MCIDLLLFYPLPMGPFLDSQSSSLPKKMEGPSTYPLMSLNLWALKNGTVFFWNTQLVSKEWEIENLEVMADDNPEL